MDIIKYHTIALILGFILDLIIGDPYNLPHPIRLIGRLISWLDKSLYIPDGEHSSAAEGDAESVHSATKKDNINIINDSRNKKLMCRGIILWITVVILVGFITTLIIICAYAVNIISGIAVEAILTCYILATKSLKKESMKVYYPLKAGDINGARQAVSMIVGRDTDVLNIEGVTKACVETVAENTSDGVIAPLLYTSIAGPIAGMVYKAINTMDSMLGYHNDRYEYFGRAAAKMDDIVNFIPARISAVMMLVAACVLNIVTKDKYDIVNGYKIFVRDRFNHKSPNSAQTESVAAGLLDIRLAGDAFYFGKIVKKPFIGDDIRHINVEDIKKINALMYMTAMLSCLMLVVLPLCIIF